MRIPPINKAMLIHKVRGSPKRLISIENKDKESYVIDKVRLSSQDWFITQGEQQTNMGNGRLFGCPIHSGRVDGQMPKFSIGDTIEFMSAPVYPKLTTILSITPLWDVDGKTLHHLEIVLR